MIASRLRSPTPLATSHLHAFDDVGLHAAIAEFGFGREHVLVAVAGRGAEVRLEYGEAAVDQQLHQRGVVVVELAPRAAMHHRQHRQPWRHPCRAAGSGSRAAARRRSRGSRARSFAPAAAPAAARRRRVPAPGFRRRCAQLRSYSQKRSCDRRAPRSVSSQRAPSLGVTLMLVSGKRLPISAAAPCARRVQAVDAAASAVVQRELELLRGGRQQHVAQVGQRGRVGVQHAPRLARQVDLHQALAVILRADEHVQRRGRRPTRTPGSQLCRRLQRGASTHLPRLPVRDDLHELRRRASG